MCGKSWRREELIEDDCVVQALLRVQPVLALPPCERAARAQQLGELFGIL
jgi:hypothetical protein